MKSIHWLRTLVVVSLSAGLMACASTPKQDLTATSGVTSPQVQGEQLVWSSTAERPAWTMSEPETDGGFMYFVGVSGNMATEQLARTDSMRDATNKVVNYMGTLAKDKFERARVSLGLASTVVDPTEGSRQFEKQLAANVAKQLKAKEHYTERWILTTGNAWKNFVLSKMPMETVNESLSNTAEENIRKAQEDAKAAATQTAKKQAEDAATFWKQMKEQGLVD